MTKRSFLIVRRQGHGKSSVGNSLLQTKQVTPQKASAQRPNVDVAENKETFVVDTTGIGDVGSDMLGDVQCVIKTAHEAVLACQTGFDALIFVMKYGVRFTKQEKDAVQMVKSIFGENVFRDWGILVFSYGDNFYLDTEDDGTTFESWCREQTGDIRNLFEEVNYRCAIFDNRQKHSKLQDEERKKVLEINPASQRPYSEQDFQAASAGREKLILQEKFELLKKETDAVLLSTDQGRERLLRNDRGLDNNDMIRQLDVLLEQTQKHYNKLLDEDKGTNVLRALLDQVRLRTIGLRSRMDQLRIVLPDRGRKRIERSRIVVLFYYLLGFFLNSFNICFDYCLKPVFYFTYGLVGRFLQYFYNVPHRYQNIIALFYNFLGFIVNILNIYLDYCLKPVYYFICGLVVRCLQHCFNTPARREVERKYAA